MKESLNSTSGMKNRYCVSHLNTIRILLCEAKYLINSYFKSLSFERIDLIDPGFLKIISFSLLRTIRAKKYVSIRPNELYFLEDMKGVNPHRRANVKYVLFCSTLYLCIFLSNLLLRHCIYKHLGSGYIDF